MTDTRDDHGKGNALAWFQSIVEMVDVWRMAEAETSSDLTPHDCIIESVLSVEVRSGWYKPFHEDIGEAKPVEYCILLSTGGPAARLIGDLDDHGEPETARLEYQDWDTPWTELPASALVAAEHPRPGETAWNSARADRWLEETDKAKEYLLTFARQFYFGEG